MNYQEVHDEILGGPEKAKRICVAFEGMPRVYAIKRIEFEEDTVIGDVICLIILKGDK